MTSTLSQGASLASIQPKIIIKNPSSRTIVSPVMRLISSHYKFRARSSQEGNGNYNSWMKNTQQYKVKTLCLKKMETSRNP